MDPGGGFAFACFSTCPGLGRIVYGASSWFPNNVACNFPVDLLYIEIVSLQFQRFWVMRKIRSTELHATFGRAAQRLPLNRTCQGLGESPRPRPWGSCRAPASSVGESPRPRRMRTPCPGLVPTEQGARPRTAQARNRGCVCRLSLGCPWPLGARLGAQVRALARGHEEGELAWHRSTLPSSAPVPLASTRRTSCRSRGSR